METCLHVAENHFMAVAVFTRHLIGNKPIKICTHISIFLKEYYLDLCMHALMGAQT